MRNGKRLWYVALAISIATNIVLLAKLYHPTLIGDIRAAFQPPPVALPVDHVLGNPNARATIIVYMDFQCPFCARFHRTLTSLTRTASVKVIYRHFPLDGHPLAMMAAEASECADEQGKFWEYGNALFNHQKGMQKDTFNTLAASLGLNMGEFESCLSTERYKQRVLADRADGLKRNILGTPAVFINGKRFNGVVPEKQLETIIQQDSARQS